jgi:hypothetical protein
MINLYSIFHCFLCSQHSDWVASETSYSTGRCRTSTSCATFRIRNFCLSFCFSCFINFSYRIQKLVFLIHTSELLKKVDCISINLPKKLLSWVVLLWILFNYLSVDLFSSKLMKIYRILQKMLLTSVTRIFW